MQLISMRTITGIAVMAALFFSRQAGAAELADDALKILTTGKTWTVSKTLGNQVSVWKWNADGTVCMWLGSQDGKCTDEGTWKVVDKRICYKFTWWLKSAGFISACFSVVDLGNGNYEAKLPSGTRFLVYRVSP